MMEKSLRKYSWLILACLLSLPALLHADDNLQKAQKAVVRKLTITKGVQLSINNQYGNVEIQRWKQKTVRVKVTITGQSAKLERANMLIQFVSIKTSNTPEVVSLETAIDTEKQHIDPSSGEQCHINYQLFVPGGLKLSITNRFGDIHVKSFDGDLAIDEKFGDLKIEHTTGPLRTNVEQGNADIDRLKNGLIKFKGFNYVQIGQLSGTVDAKFWSGGKVDLGLSGDLQKLSINADNVKPVNINYLNAANADVKIHSTVSKIIYNGQIMFTLDKKKLNYTEEKQSKPDTGVLIVGMSKGDTTQKPKEKLLDLKKIRVTALKHQDYTLKTGSATTDIKIDASFSVINIKD